MAAASDVAVQRARWEAADIDSYEFTVTWTSANAFVGDYRVTVIDGQPHRVVRSDGLEIDPDEMAGERPVTIDEVFDIIEDMLSADTFTATYDHVSGHPVDVYVDEFAGVVDDEFHIRISDFGLDPEVPAVTADSPGHADEEGVPVATRGRSRSQLAATDTAHPENGVFDAAACRISAVRPRFAARDAMSDFRVGSRAVIHRGQCP